MKISKEFIEKKQSVLLMLSELIKYIEQDDVQIMESGFSVYQETEINAVNSQPHVEHITPTGRKRLQLDINIFQKQNGGKNEDVDG